MEIESLVKPNIRALRAYEAKEIPCRVKLDANESPFGFPYVKGIKTNRYPDPEAAVLKKTFADQIGVRPSGVLLGNGSDELIYYLITTFGGPVLYPTPTFSMYGIIASALGEKAIGIPLDKSFDLDMKAMLGVIKKDKPKLIFLSSPNNPTGNCFSEDDMLDILNASKGVVVLDEAYLPFSERKSFISHLFGHPNLFVMRTLSKVGLAALRVGFLIGSGRAIAQVNKVRLPFNLNSVSQALAVRALRDGKRLNSYIEAIVRERGRLHAGLSRIKGVTCYPSEANFILFRVKDSDRVYKGLLKRGVLVRNMPGLRAPWLGAPAEKGPILSLKSQGYLRVTVGTKRENDIFLKALRETFSTL